MITWLSNLSIAKFVIGRGRLLLEYALIALVIAVSAVVVTLWFQNKKLETSNTALGERVAVVETANTINEGTISALQQARETDAEVISALSRTHKQLKLTDDDVRKRILELEKQNEAIKEYLERPIPAELACLLFGTCRPASDSENRVDPPAGVPTRSLLPPKGSNSSPAKNSTHS